MRVMIAAFAIALAAACASPPKYQEATVLGMEGYTDQNLGEDRYQVSFTGTPSSTTDSVRDFALLRAAELTLRAEGDWFEVITESPIANVDAARLAALSDTGPGIAKDCGVLGCRDVLETNRPFGSGAYSAGGGKVFAHSLEIRVHSGEMPADAANAYDAKATSLLIWDRYNLIP
ncbi:MAG: hypothetical protein AAFX03_10220 [Pseudomonadota bacterium]